LDPVEKERNEVEEAVGDIDSSSSSSDSTGLNIGEVEMRSEVRSSLMLRCLRIGLRGWILRVGLGEKRSSRSCAGLGLGPSTLSGTGRGLGGGVQSTAVCRGPYNHVTSESFNLIRKKYNK